MTQFTPTFFLKDRQLGTLYLVDILLEYDYPRIFVCENDKHIKYLFSEYISEQDIDKWIMCKINNNLYNKLKTSKIALQDCFQHSGCYYDIIKDYKTNKMDVKKIATIPENVFVQNKVYL